MTVGSGVQKKTSVNPVAVFGATIALPCAHYSLSNIFRLGDAKGLCMPAACFPAMPKHSLSYAELRERSLGINFLPLMHWLYQRV